MLNLSLGWRPWETKMYGHDVKMEVRPLKNSEIAPVVSLIVEQADAPDNASRANASLKLQKMARPIMESAVRNIEGIQIDGAIPTIDQYCDESVLCGITSTIVNYLVSISSITPDEMGNLDGQSEKEDQEDS